MGKFLSSETIQAATQRLIDSRAKSGFVDFLVLKRALALAKSSEVSFSSTDADFTGAMVALAATYPAGIAHPAPTRSSPFVKVFGTAGAEKYVTQKWRSNGPADTLSGPKWRSVVQIDGSNPRRGSLKAGYESSLAMLLLKAGPQLPALTDAAIWFHRAEDLEARFGTVPDAAKLEASLRESFINELGLTDAEVAVLFNVTSNPLLGQPLAIALRDAVANPQDYLPDLAIGSGELDKMLSAFDSLANSPVVGLRVVRELTLRVASSLCAKRFLILTGLAGSGKTKLAQAFAHWITPAVEDEDETSLHHVIVPVGADWTGSENVLGYPNGLDKGSYVSKPALDLILHAQVHSAVPHFLILDEMNLSHVERYFADILSAIESESSILLHRDSGREANGQEVPPELELPRNLFIIGTVNVDETTYMFSPKVLDRANVIEFRMDAAELEGFLDNPTKPNLSNLDGDGASYGKRFVEAAKNPVAVPASVKAAYDAEILLFFKTLQAHGAEFGYRTAYETARFIHFYKLLGNHADGDTTWFHGAFDCVVLQKLLPKLHGSRAKLGPVLKKLWFLCVNDAAGRGVDALKAAEEAARSTDKKKAEPSVIVPAGAPYPLSAEKIGRMWRLLLENGFTSFAEA